MKQEIMNMSSFPFYFFLFPLILAIELRGAPPLRYIPSPLHFEVGSLYAAKAGPKLVILLPPKPPESLGFQACTTVPSYLIYFK